MGLPSRGHANDQARDDLLGPAPGLGLAFAPWLATPLHLLVRQLVRFVRLIIDPLRQVITSSRVSSRIRAQGLSHHADRARGNLAAKRPENLVGGNYQPFHASLRTTISPMSPAGGALAMALRAAAGPLGNRTRTGNASTRPRTA